MKKLSHPSLLKLLPSLIVISFFHFANEQIIQKIYTQSIFVVLARSLRWLNISFFFSIGDVVYILVFLFLLFLLILFFFKKKYLHLKQTIVRLGMSLLHFYAFFLIIWGGNYFQTSINQQFNIEQKAYSLEELQAASCYFLEEANSLSKKIQVSHRDSLQSSEKNTFQEISVLAAKATKLALGGQAFDLYVADILVKKSLFTPIISKMGYSGYYNPFTAEAQVCADFPRFLLPFVSVHEMAHQLGYANESEANFIAYYVCNIAQNERLRYAALAELFLTVNAALFEYDPQLAIANLKTCNRFLKADLKEYKKYVLKNQSDAEYVSKVVYDTYLKLNQQKNGIKSYDDVISWVISFEQRQNGILLPH